MVYYDIPYLKNLKIYPELPKALNQLITDRVVHIDAGTGSGKTVGVPRYILEHMIQSSDDLSNRTGELSIQRSDSSRWRHPFHTARSAARHPRGQRFREIDLPAAVRRPFFCPKRKRFVRGERVERGNPARREIRLRFSSARRLRFSKSRRATFQSHGFR